MDEDDPEKRKPSNRLVRWRKYIEISDLGAIARRYFVMNAFDGALTMLGVVIGASMSHISDPNVVIIAGISGSFAMGVSGFSGAYMAESAERKREIKNLERAMLKPMEETLHEEAARFATTVTALVDAISPALAAMLVILPYIGVELGYLDMSSAFVLSLAITMSVLTVLGMYLARVTEESMLRHGLKMLIVGMVTAILCSLVAISLGGTVVV